jgi:hypothetical protein
MNANNNLPQHLLEEDDTAVLELMPAEKAQELKKANERLLYDGKICTRKNGGFRKVCVNDLRVRLTILESRFASREDIEAPKG